MPRMELRRDAFFSARRPIHNEIQVMFKHPLARELAFTVAVKLLLLTVIWFAFFRPAGTSGPVDPAIPDWLSSPQSGYVEETQHGAR